MLEPLKGIEFLCLTSNKIIMQEIKLSVLEKRMLEKGLATQRVRLKAGRIIWDELDASLQTATGEAWRDEDRLYEFKKLVENRPFYDKMALKEWLEAQVSSDQLDVIDDDSSRSKMIVIYKEHLDVL